MSKQAYRMSQDVAQVSSPPTSWRWAPGPLAAIAVHSNEGLYDSLLTLTQASPPVGSKNALMSKFCVLLLIIHNSLAFQGIKSHKLNLTANIFCTKH